MTIFSRIHEQEGGMSMGLVMMLLDAEKSGLHFLPNAIEDVLGLSDFLFVFRLKTNILSVSCMEYYQWRIIFEG
jgi:hypothetical protein